MSKSNKVFIGIGISIALILLSLLMFYCFHGIYSVAIQELRPLPLFLPLILTILILYISILFYSYDLFVKNISKKIYKIFFIVLAIIEIISLILFFFKSSFHFNGIHARTIYFFFINVINIVFLTFGLCISFLPSPNMISDLLTKCPKIFSNLPTWKFAFYGIIGAFAFGFFGDALPAFFRFGYYNIEPVWYWILLLIFTVPLVSSLLEVLQLYYRKNLYFSINVLLNILSLALLLNIILNTQVLAHVAQNLFYIDFAAAYYIFPYVFFAFHFYFIVHGMWSLIWNIRKQKIVNN